MVTEQDLMERLARVLLELDEESFIEIVNDYLGTDYTYSDIVWRNDD